MPGGSCNADACLRTAQVLDHGIGDIHRARLEELAQLGLGNVKKDETKSDYWFLDINGDDGRSSENQSELASCSASSCCH